MNLRIFLLKFRTWLWWAFTPPYLRNPIMLAWGSVLMKSKGWASMAVFKQYMLNGVQPPPVGYSTSATYTTGNKIIYYINGAGAYYGDNAVYEAISINADGSDNAGFTNTPPIIGNIVPQTMPATVTNSTQALAWLSQYKWILVSPNFMGALQRTSFSSQKLLYEYALNLWFNTTFREPVIGVSDIYIKPLSVVLNQMYFYPNTNNCFFIPKTILNQPYYLQSKYFFPTSPSAPYNNFTIYIPNAVYTNLSANAGMREQIVRNFADLLCPAGSYYNVVTY